MKIGIIKISNWQWWLYMWRSNDKIGIFRNSKDIIPGRWGFYFLGLEIGSRNPGNWFGTLLKRNGLWPW